MEDLNKELCYIGLGIMGSAMAANLARAGCHVMAWNRTPGRPNEQLLAKAGVQICPGLGDAVNKADIIFLCVSDVSDLYSVVLGANGVATHAKKGSILVDMGTTGPKAAIDLAGKLKAHNLTFMDCPVTGGDIGAQNATLTIMVGAEANAFHVVEPYLRIMGNKIVHCGPVGAGQAVKLCNQILCALNMVGVCEAISLAKNLGLDGQLVVDVCAAGGGGSWALANLGPRINNLDFAPGFKIKDILKDIRLVKEAVAEFKLPGLSLAEDLFRKAGAIGDLEDGTQAMFRAYILDN